MKALIASVAAVAALCAAVPAAAQGWGPAYGQNNRFAPTVGRESARLEQRIEVGLRNGALTWSEARALRVRLDQVRQLEWRYARDGRVTPNEARELDRRFADLNARIRIERRDRDDRRGYGSGYGNGYGGGYGYRR